MTPLARHGRRLGLWRRWVGTGVGLVPAVIDAHQRRRGQAVEQDAECNGHDDRLEQRLLLGDTPFEYQQPEHDRGEAARLG